MNHLLQASLTVGAAATQLWKENANWCERESMRIVTKWAASLIPPVNGCLKMENRSIWPTRFPILPPEWAVEMTKSLTRNIHRIFLKEIAALWRIIAINASSEHFHKRWIIDFLARTYYTAPWPLLAIRVYRKTRNNGFYWWLVFVSILFEYYFHA